MRTTILALLLFFTTTILSSQTTSIPDSNFEQALIDLGHDDVLDGEVLNSNISPIASLVVQDYGISDLTGIEGFTNLVSLNCYSNQITTLDLSQNALLEDLLCSNNFLSVLNLTQNSALRTLNCVASELTSLDLSQNPNLEYVYCPINMLTSLDVSQNPLLNFLGCQENQITSLDLSDNPLLTTLFCHSNDLNCLNVANGNNEMLFDFTAYMNPQLTCIEADDAVWAYNSWFRFIDENTIFSENCSNDCSTGIVDIYNSFSTLSIFPNPTKGSFTIDLGNYHVNLKATLSNSLGQIISFEEHQSIDSFQMEIDAPAGIYFLRLEDERNEMQVFKVLIE